MDGWMGWPVAGGVVCGCFCSAGLSQREIFEMTRVTITDVHLFLLSIAIAIETLLRGVSQTNLIKDESKSRNNSIVV